MAWYHWLAGYMLIAGGVIFYIIPYKPLWLWGVIALLIIGGLLLGVFLPHDEEKYAQKNKGG